MDFENIFNKLNPQQYSADDFDYAQAVEENKRKQQLANGLMNFNPGGQQQMVSGYLVGGLRNPLQTVIAALSGVAGAKLQANSDIERKNMNEVGRQVYRDGIQLVKNNGQEDERRLAAIQQDPARFVGQDLSQYGINDTTDADRVKRSAGAQVEAIRLARAEGIEKLRRSGPDGQSFAKLFDQQDVKSAFPQERQGLQVLQQGAVAVDSQGRVVARNDPRQSDIKVSGQTQNPTTGMWDVMLSNGETRQFPNPVRIGDVAPEAPIVLSPGQTVVRPQDARTGYQAPQAPEAPKPFSLGRDEVRFDANGREIARGPASEPKGDKVDKDRQMNLVAFQSAQRGLAELRSLLKRFKDEGTYEKATSAIGLAADKVSFGILGGGNAAAAKELEKPGLIAMEFVRNIMKANGLSPTQLSNTQGEQANLAARFFSIDPAQQSPAQVERAMNDGLAALEREAQDLANRVKAGEFDSRGSGTPGQRPEGALGSGTFGALPPSGIAPSWMKDRK